MSSDDIYETDIGVIAWPHLVTPWSPCESNLKPRYDCCLLFDFPAGVVAAAKASVPPKSAIIYWPVRSMMELNVQGDQLSWFKWRLNASSETLVPCMGRYSDALISPADIRPGDRVQLGVTFRTYLRPDNKKRGVAAKLRYVRRIGGPIRGEDV